MSNVLIVAAHPDDEVLGCGIAIQYHKAKGDRVYMLMMTYGSEWRYDSLNHQSKLDRDVKAMIKILGVDFVDKHYFPHQGLDTIKLTELITPIEKTIEHRKIDIVYTHHYGEVNKDHRLVYEATITACRPTPTCGVKTLLSYWIPSSSEWMRYDNNIFTPNYIIEATEDQLELKIKAMEAYQSELREWPHPRSCEGLKTYAKTFGMQFGIPYAEPFQLLYNKQ